MLLVEALDLGLVVGELLGRNLLAAPSAPPLVHPNRVTLEPCVIPHGCTGPHLDDVVVGVAPLLSDFRELGVLLPLHMEGEHPERPQEGQGRRLVGALTVLPSPAA